MRVDVFAKIDEANERLERMGKYADFNVPKLARFQVQKLENLKTASEKFRYPNTKVNKANLLHIESVLDNFLKSDWTTYNGRARLAGKTNEETEPGTNGDAPKGAKKLAKNYTLSLDEALAAREVFSLQAYHRLQDVGIIGSPEAIILATSYTDREVEQGLTYLAEHRQYLTNENFLTRFERATKRLKILESFDELEI